MYSNILVLFCVTIIVITNTEAFVRRDLASQSSQPNVLESFQKNVEQFKNCIDQSLAKTVGEVNEKQLQPIFNILGDQLNRVSKAFEDLTATKSPTTF